MHPFEHWFALWQEYLYIMISEDENFEVMFNHCLKQQKWEGLGKQKEERLTNIKKKQKEIKQSNQEKLIK